MGGSSSPMHVRGGGHVRSGSAGPSNFRRPQQARAAAQRLARVMAHQPAEDDDGSDTDRDHDDGDDDDDFYQPPSARVARRSRSPAVGRNLGDNSPSVRSVSTGQLFMMAKPGPLIPAIKPLTRPLLTAQSPDPTIVNWRNKRLSVDLGNFNVRETTNPPRSASALQDEIDMLQEENENILDKLRLVEKGGEEAEARSRELEKQAALRVATQTSDATNVEVTALRLEIEAARDEALSAAEHLQEAEYEIKSFKTMTQRMKLTQEEMEEVILKRCWLARYWKLCLSHGIYPEIAEEKHEYWSSLAPLPFEVVISAGQKSKDDFSAGPALSEFKIPFEGQNLVVEAFELNPEESEDVLFKQLKEVCWS
ncbi:hypothetical protein QJS10_CPB04g00773 [Acorus calamus]|uniref:Coiled-coil domain-containing protein SCD2 n=1 Tax=Acorus calamus TaxID=4465 RepID=A0AAV9F3K4_ACOCL|nr:hypothetical protein QJS10_CPB04g00773 [Acorus calamus]